MNNFQKKKENVSNTIYDNLSFFFLLRKLTNLEFSLFIETYFRTSEWMDFFHLYTYTI